MNHSRTIKLAFLVNLFISFLTNPLNANVTDIDGVGALKDEILHVNATEAAQLLKANPAIRVLDVRTGFEHGMGHIEGSVNINYYSFSFKRRLAELDKNVTWLVHCKVGVRSGKTLPLMKEAGFLSIIHLDGGIDSWKDADLPVIK